MRGDRLLFKEKETRPPRGEGERRKQAVCMCRVCARARVSVHVSVHAYACAWPRASFPSHWGEPWGLRFWNIAKGIAPEPERSPGVSQVFSPQLISLTQYLLAQSGFLSLFLAFFSLNLFVLSEFHQRLDRAQRKRNLMLLAFYTLFLFFLKLCREPNLRKIKTAGLNAVLDCINEAQ